MGQNAQTDRSRRGYITIDWLVLAVAGIAFLFLMGTLLRTAVDAEVLASNGFYQLGGDDTLLAYQDFNFEATGWAPAETSDRVPGIGPVLGPFGSEPVQRSFAMPSDATVARISFDLHLVGDWAEQQAFHAFLAETEVLAIELPDSSPVGEFDARALQDDRVAVAVQGAGVTPRRAEVSLPGGGGDFMTLRVRIVVADPPETLSLRLHADTDGTGEWMLDNFAVVATSGDQQS